MIFLCGFSLLQHPAKFGVCRTDFVVDSIAQIDA